MARIEVKCVEGRIARTDPQGPFIPDDRFIKVEETPYIRRLIDVHGDLMVKPPVAETAAPKPPAPTKKKEARRSAPRAPKPPTRVSLH